MSIVETYAKAFAEWDRRYREEPEKFTSDFERIAKGQTTSEYGEIASKYFEKLLVEV